MVAISVRFVFWVEWVFLSLFFFFFWSFVEWQVYDKLLWQLFLSSMSLFKVPWSLLVMSFSICRRFLFLVTFPIILPSIILRSSESCHSMCPIHLTLCCRTKSKMIYWTLCSTLSFATLSTELIFFILLQSHISNADHLSLSACVIVRVSVP